MSIEESPHAESLLTLFQLIDSFFPTGAFAHSFGLETYVQQGVIGDRETLSTFLRSSLFCGIRNTDAIAIAKAYRATEIEPIIDLDARLTALKLPSESRQASIRIGRQFLRNAKKLVPNPAFSMVDAYDLHIRNGVCTGHHAIAYGLITAAASIDLFQAQLGYLHAYVVGQVSAAVRLIPLGVTDGQRVIEAVRPELVQIAHFAHKAELKELGSFTPGLDIRSMQHERLYSRLFIS